MSQDSMKDFFYKFLPDLPPVPDSVITTVDFDLKPTHMELGVYNQRTLTNWHGRSYVAVANIRIRNPAFSDWFEKNITVDINDAGVNYAVYNHDTGQGLELSCGAHTDSSRDFALLYVIKSGGANVTTDFWREKDQPLHRSRRTHVEDTSQIDLVESIHIPEKTWILLEGRILHSVEHLTETRIAFQVGFDYCPW
jgi:hypothetical protein